MENASKALLMAGGILIAIITLSVFVLAYTYMTDAKQAQVDQKMQEEILNFNTPFLAFNKKAMYGVDVISVLNLAIDNNKIYNTKAGEEYYVNIYFKLTEDSVQDAVYKYTLNQTTSRWEIQIDERADIGYGDTNLKFEKGNTYNLENNLESIQAFLLTAEKNEEIKYDIEKNGDLEIKYKIRYSGIADFKRKTFKCSGVEFDNTGRVNAMHFEQIGKSTYAN